MTRQNLEFLIWFVAIFILFGMLPSCSNECNLQIDESFIVYFSGKAKVDTFVTIKNPNKHHISIDSVFGSCSCMEVKYPKIISAEQVEKIYFSVMIKDSTMFTSSILIKANKLEPILVKIFGNFSPKNYNYENN